MNFIQLAFFAGETFDNNFNKGYTIQLWSKGKVCKGSNASLSTYFMNLCTTSGATANQEKGENLDKAEEMSAWATAEAKKEVATPAATKPKNMTTSAWAKQRERTYASYADTYAMVLFKLGNYKNGFTYTREAAITITNGNDASLNDTWALLAETAIYGSKA